MMKVNGVVPHCIMLVNQGMIVWYPCFWLWMPILNRNVIKTLDLYIEQVQHTLSIHLVPFNNLSIQYPVYTPHQYTLPTHFMATHSINRKDTVLHTDPTVTTFVEHHRLQNYTASFINTLHYHCYNMRQQHSLFRKSHMCESATRSQL